MINCCIGQESFFWGEGEGVFMRFFKGILLLPLSYFVKQSTVLSLHSCGRSVVPRRNDIITNFKSPKCRRELKV